MYLGSNVDVPSSKDSNNLNTYIWVGTWLGMDLKSDTRTTYVHKRLEYLLEICQPFYAR